MLVVVIVVVSNVLTSFANRRLSSGVQSSDPTAPLGSVGRKPIKASKMSRTVMIENRAHASAEGSCGSWWLLLLLLLLLLSLTSPSWLPVLRMIGRDTQTDLLPHLETTVRLWQDIMTPSSQPFRV